MNLPDMSKLSDYELREFGRYYLIILNAFSPKPIEGKEMLKSIEDYIESRKNENNAKVLDNCTDK